MLTFPKKNRKGMIFATQEISVLKFAKKLLVLKNGKVRTFFESTELTTVPSFFMTSKK